MLYPARSALVTGAQMRSINGFCPSPEYAACNPTGTEGGKDVMRNNAHQRSVVSLNLHLAIGPLDDVTAVTR